VSDHPERRNWDAAVADLERRLDARLDEHEAATAQRAAQLEARIDAQLQSVIEEVRRLADAVGAIEREQLVAEAREAGRREALQDVAEATSPGRPAPLLGEPRGWDRLAQWVTQWSPWQVLVGLALLVGGPTVAGPAVERLLSTLLPTTTTVQLEPAPSARELIDTGESRPPRAVP
jgi:hypothetical protein